MAWLYQPLLPSAAQLNASGGGDSLVATEILTMAQVGFQTAAEPFKIADAVTKSDATVFTHFTDALYVGDTGTVVVRMKSGQTVTFAGVAAGSTLLIQVDKVLDASNPGTNILALYRGKL
jgi:hypothetical protein